MNELESYIVYNKMSEVTGKVFNLENKTSGEIVWLYTRVLHNTLTGQSIFLKYFFNRKNFMISVNPSSKGGTDWFYISNISKEWEPVQEFTDSIANFKSKPASLPTRTAIEV